MRLPMNPAAALVESLPDDPAELILRLGKDARGYRTAADDLIERVRVAAEQGAFDITNHLRAVLRNAETQARQGQISEVIPLEGLPVTPIEIQGPNGMFPFWAVPVNRIPHDHPLATHEPHEVHTAWGGERYLILATYNRPGERCPAWAKREAVANMAENARVLARQHAAVNEAMQRDLEAKAADLHERSLTPADHALREVRRLQREVEEMKRNQKTRVGPVANG